MWNLLQGNSNMNSFERLMQHKGHLERIALSKNSINNKKPMKPSFLKKKLINMGEKIERKFKVNQDNNALFRKMFEISKKNSKYAECLNKPLRCPAYDNLTHNRYMKYYETQNENKKMHKRLASARPAYLSSKYLKDYKYKEYLERNIGRKKNDINPCLDFVTSRKFNKNLMKELNDYNYKTNFSTINNNLFKKFSVGKRVIIKTKSCGSIKQPKNYYYGNNTDNCYNIYQNNDLSNGLSWDNNNYYQKMLKNYYSPSQSNIKISYDLYDNKFSDNNSNYNSDYINKNNSNSNEIAYNSYGWLNKSSSRPLSCKFKSTYISKEICNNCSNFSNKEASTSKKGKKPISGKTRTSGSTTIPSS